MRPEDTKDFRVWVKTRSTLGSSSCDARGSLDLGDITDDPHASHEVTRTRIEGLVNRLTCQVAAQVIQLFIQCSDPLYQIQNHRGASEVDPQIVMQPLHPTHPDNTPPRQKRLATLVALSAGRLQQTETSKAHHQ